MLRSSSLLLAGRPCFWYPFCLLGCCCWVPVEEKFGPPVFVAFGGHPSLLPVHPAPPDVIPLAANKSSTLRVALATCSTYGSRSSSGLSFDISSKEGLLFRGRIKTHQDRHDPLKKESVKLERITENTVKDSGQRLTKK